MVKTKIYMGIAIIVALGMLAMFHIYRNLGNVAGYLSTLDSVSVPFSIAALEMEKNTGEYATGVLRYISDPEPAVRKEAAHDVVDFNKRLGVYMQLSTNERERALGRKVNSGLQKLVARGNALMDRRDQLDRTFLETTTLLEDIDELLDGRLPEAGHVLSALDPKTLGALQNIEAETAEVGYWLTLFRSRPTEHARQRLLEKVDEQRMAVSQFRLMRLDSGQRRLGAELFALHQQVVANVMVLLAGETEVNQSARELDLLAEQVDDIFDHDIQGMLMNDLAAPQENANLAIAHVQDSLRYIIPAYFLVAVVIGLLLIVAIIPPLRKLAAGTAAIGTGNLGYRIEAGRNDEFGALAQQFNQMAERLQESTVSRDLLEQSEQELQRTVQELRQEISERQQAEKEQQKLRGKLQRSETMAAMGQLVAGVAHEVRNPLFGISSTLDAMEANAEVGRVDPQYRDVLRREAIRLNKLMADLLEYGRTPSAGLSAEPLGRTLAEAIRTCQTVARAAQVTLVDATSDDAPVEMHHDRLLQVHVNLIENAIQHAPPGSTVTVDTRASTDAAGKRWIEYSIMDSGPGFAIEDLPRVFDPFFTRRRKGTGLGLAIVRRIVDEHHASIEPGNRPEGGAIVTVRLPVAVDT